MALESGAAVADLDGKDIDWSSGPMLSLNRGLFATDPKKARPESADAFSFAGGSDCACSMPVWRFPSRA